MGALMKTVLVGAVVVAIAGQALFWTAALSSSAADDDTEPLISGAVSALVTHLDAEIAQFIVLR